MRRCRRRWVGHVERKSDDKSDDDWVSRCRRLRVEGQRGRKTWMECVAEDFGEIETAKGGRSGSRGMAECHFEDPSNSCKHGNKDDKP